MKPVGPKANYNGPTEYMPLASCTVWQDHTLLNILQIASIYKIFMGFNKTKQNTFKKVKLGGWNQPSGSCFICNLLDRII